MNVKNLTAALLFSALNIAAFTAHAEMPVQAQTYTYGTHLDIAKVLSIVEDSASQCGVVNSRMTYQDSTGQTRALDYVKLSSACDQDN